MATAHGGVMQKHKDPRPPPRILRLPEVKAWLGVGRSMVYSQVAARLLPPPIRLGLRAVGWSSDEIGQVVAARIAGATEAEIAELVAGMVAARKQAA